MQVSPQTVLQKAPFPNCSLYKNSRSRKEKKRLRLLVTSIKLGKKQYCWSLPLNQFLSSLALLGPHGLPLVSTGQILLR